LRAYELMIIFDGDLDETDARAKDREVAGWIAARGGQIVGKPDWWGKRRFAYEIKHKTEGYYSVYELVEAEGAALDEVERSLRLADEVVRHKLIRLPDAEANRRRTHVGAPTAG
jgi:small subunit ribosomal protein S6